MLKPNNMKVDNSGTNEGVLVGINTGTINYLLQEAIKIPSLISSVVKTLGSVCIEDDTVVPSLDLSTYKPDEKIEYNCVIKYKEIIKEHAAYYTYCDDTLNIYDDSNMGSKAKILRCVRNWYLESKGQMLLELKKSKDADIDKIRNNADFLIESVINKIKQVIYESNNIIDSNIEEITIGITCFVCYCFMKCKILEKPK
jgi:hypothetical protein